MTQNTNLANFAAEVGSDIKTANDNHAIFAAFLNGNAADLTGLSTSAKNNLVAAINEVLGIAQAAANSGYTDGQADSRVQAAKGSLTTAASDKWASTADLIAELANVQANAVTAAVNQITDGAGDAYNTLKEIQTDLEGDQTVLDNLMAAVSKRVAVDQVQSFSAAEKLQGCENLGIGDPTTDFLTAYTNARDAA